MCQDSEPMDAAEVNYDKKNVPSYALPDPLVASDGQPVRDWREWAQKRRPELLELFRREMYGRSPPPPANPSIERGPPESAVGGKAVRKRIRVGLAEGKDAPRMEVLLYLPADAPGPAPVFVGMHLFDKAGDPPMPGNALREDPKPHPANQAGKQAIAGEPALQNLPGERLAETILERGYGFATIDADDVAPDDARRFMTGAIEANLPGGRTRRAADDWGAIAAWAWALSRALDAFERDPQVDAKRVIAIGHSRRGKTALWAAAQDERFAMAISNNSGCGGAALSKRRYGETVALINLRFPFWFCENFRKYNENEASLPFDQHELLALVAPRPVYVASAVEDRWADPLGEFLACVAAGPVYRLAGKVGVGTSEWPPLNRSIGGAIGYHVRTGRHALTDFDWLCYLDFADRHLKSRGE